jgi:Peptidase family M28/PA domain
MHALPELHWKPMRSMIALVSCGLIFGQMRSRTAAGYESIRANRMKADLTFLSSPELEGRLSLQRGSDIAIQWIASEFAKAGIKPVIQKTPLIEFRMDAQASGLTVKTSGKTQTYHAPSATGAFPRDVMLTAPVVFAGFGITAPELKYDDYAGLDVHGKIVLIFDHEPQETDAKSIFNGKGSTRYAGSFVKTLNAQNHGAAAVLMVSEPDRKHPSNQERLARIRGVNERARIPNQVLEVSELEIPLVNISDRIADELLGGQAKALQKSIDDTLKPASRALAGVTAEVKLIVAEKRKASSANVLGVIEGSDPKLKSETIVFTAHYDHDGLAPNGIYSGADDDGSGTVGVIALAQAFARNEIKPRRSLLFAVFAAEERGLLGSYYYVAHPLRPLAATRAVINFDMIGRNEAESPQTVGLLQIAKDTSNELNLIGANYSPDYVEAVENANLSIGLKLNYKWDEEPALNIYFRSDHYPFALHDVPALWWFTGFHPDYHQTSDTVEKINFDKMEKIVRLAFLTGFQFADDPNAPRFRPIANAP